MVGPTVQGMPAAMSISQTDIDRLFIRNQEIEDDEDDDFEQPTLINTDLVVMGHEPKNEPSRMTIYKSDPNDLTGQSELYQAYIGGGKATRVIGINFEDGTWTTTALLAICLDRIVYKKDLDPLYELAADAVQQALNCLLDDERLD